MVKSIIRCISALNPYTTILVYKTDWRIYTISKYIVCKWLAKSPTLGVTIDKPTPNRIIIPAPEVIQPCLLIVHIPTIAEGIQRTQCSCQGASFCLAVCPRHRTCTPLPWYRWRSPAQSRRPGGCTCRHRQCHRRAPPRACSARRSRSGAIACPCFYCLHFAMKYILVY